MREYGEKERVEGRIRQRKFKARQKYVTEMTRAGIERSEALKSFELQWQSSFQGAETPKQWLHKIGISNVKHANDLADAELTAALEEIFESDDMNVAIDEENRQAEEYVQKLYDQWSETYENTNCEYSTEAVTHAVDALYNAALAEECVVNTMTYTELLLSEVPPLY